MYKNSQGETVSAEQMQKWADANDMSIEEYAALAGYTLSGTEETKEVDPGKTTGSVANVDPDPDPSTESWWNTGLGSEDGFSESANTKDSSLKPNNLQIAEKALKKISITKEDRNRFLEQAGQTYTVSAPGSDPRVPSRPITKNNYDPFINEAKKLIAESSNNKYDIYSVPKSEWIQKSKELYAEKEEEKLFEKKVEDVLNEYEDNVFGAWYSPARIAKAFNPFNSEAQAFAGVNKVNLLTKADSEYLAGRTELSSTFEQESKLATEGYKNTVEVIKVHAPIIESSEIALNKLEYKFNNTPDQIDQEDVDNYNSLLNTYSTAKKILNTQYEKLGDLESTAKTTAGLADMTLRTYNTIDIIGNRLASASVTAAAGLGTVLFELSPQQVIKRVSGYDISEEDSDLPVYLKAIGGLSSAAGTKAFKDGVDSLWSQSEKINKYTQKRQELGEINDLGDFGEFMIDLFSEQAINTAITVGTGGAGLAAISASAAGSKFHEMELEMESIPGLKYTAAQFYGTGFIYGASEYITESVSLGQAKGLLNRFGFGSNNFKKAYKIDGGYTLETLSKSQAFIKAGQQWGINTSKEGGAEGLVQLFNNTADRYILGKDVAITEGLGESIVTGSLMSGLGFNAPVLLADLAVAFKTDSKIAEYNNRTKKILDLRTNLNTILKNSDMENDVAAQQTATKLQGEIDGMLTENLLGMKQDIEVIKNLERNDKQQLIDLDTEIYNRKKEIDKINNNPKLDNAIKKDLIVKLQQQISTGNTQKNIILTSNQNSKQKKDVSNFQTELTVKTGKVMHVANGETISQAVEKGIQIVNEAEAAGKLEPELAKAIIEEINRAAEAGAGNGNGFQIGAAEGFPIAFSVDETLIKNGMGRTVLHESGHATVFSALLEGNADILGIVAEMESYVTTRFKGAKEIFATIEEKYSDQPKEKIAEEKLAALLDFRPDLGGMDKTTAGKLLGFWDKIKPTGKNQEITSIKTGADVYNLITGFARAFDQGQVSELAAKVIRGEVKAAQKKTNETSKEVNKKTTSFSLGDSKGLSNNNKVVEELNAQLEDLLDNEYEMDEGDFESQKSNLELKIRQAKAKESKSSADPKAKTSVLYNASPKEFDQLGKTSGLIFLATDKKEAEAYAESNRGKVREVLMDESSISTEQEVLKEIKALGVDISEGLLYEMIDPRFEDYYIGKDNIDKLLVSLKNKGVKGFRYSDGSQISSKDTQSVAIIDRSAISENGKAVSKTSKKPSVKKEGLTKEKADGKRNFTSNDKNDLFSTANTAFNNTARDYRVNLKLDKEGNPEFTKEEWDAVPLNTKLGIGVMIGEKFKPYVEYLMGSRRDVPGFDEFASQIIERTATGLEKGDDGIPFLLKTYDPSKGTKITTHVFGQINNRLQGVINKTEGFGESTVDTAPSETNKNQLVSEETADSNINTEERARSEGKKKEFAKITDEVIVLDNNGKATTISEKVATEVKNAVKVVYATTKFKNEIGTKEYRTELVNALRNKLGNLFRSIMDRGVNYNNDSKVGNSEKRANYDAFVDSNFKSVYSIMPKSTISDRFPFLMEPVLNQDGTPYFMSAAEVDAYNDALDRGEVRGKRIANKYAGNRVFKKRPYDAQVKKEGTEYLKANDKATNVRNARKTSFADVIAEEAALDILPEVLRENGFEKEAVIEQIELQIGRAQFSIGGLNEAQVQLFEIGAPAFTDHLRTNKLPYTTENVTAIFNEVYNTANFTDKQKQGIVKQFVDQLAPFNKKGVEIEKTKEFFKDFVDKIVSQADQNKNLINLISDSGVSMASLFRNLIDKATGKDVRIIARGHFVQFALEMKKNRGVEETIQNLISFGNPTFNSSGISGVAQVFNYITNKYINNPVRKTKSYDLFTKNDDFLKNVLQKIDPTIVSFTRSTVTRKVEGKEKLQKEKIKYIVANTVTKDMAKNISNNTYDNTEQNKTAEAAKEFVIDTFKYIATIKDPIIRAVLTANLNDGSNNAFRAAAKVTHTADGYINLDPRAYRYEHLLASRNALGLAYDYYVNGNKSIDIDALWNDYQVAIVPRTMDAAVNKAGFAYTSYAGYIPGKSSIFERYYNIFTMGKVQYALRSIDGKTIIGKNFADFYKENGGKTTVNKNIVEDMSKYRASVEKKEVTVKKASFSKGNLSNEFNSMIQRDKGVESYKTFSKMVARRRGASAGKFKYWMPSSLDDFKGLTSYTFSGKGKQGEADQKFFNDNLINPYFAGIRAIETSKQTFKNDITGLNKMFKPTVKMLKKLTPDGDYTYDQAIRVYLWTKSGFEIEGLSKRDALKLNELVANDENLAAYADGLQLISKREKWVKPSEYWDAETLLSDLNNMTEKEGRKAYLEEFIDNANAIFSKENLYKIEALYGTKHADALKDILFRMENGTNRPSGSNKNVNKFNNWLNNSIGAIMFFNRRSALLQTLSTANFINWSDNNPGKAALAFANQPQFWKDFAMIFNSDMLKQRRSGLKTDVSEAEIATAAKGAKNKASAVLSYLLKIGFTPTQMVDSFAIASGGSAFYRNRVNTYKAEYVADGDKLERKYTDKEAEAKAFVDFSQISEETQQSGDPALISSDQASVLGRVLLSFQNTPIQLNRSIKKSAQDIYNRRRAPNQTQLQSDLGNLSKIIYYGAIQNIIFSALQNALFALIPGFGDEDDDLTEEEQLAKYNKIVTTKESRIINGMVDTTLKGGFGLPGAVVSTIKNVVIEYNKQEEKGFLSDHAYTLLQAVNLSPPVGSKFRKIYTAIQTNKFEKDAIKQRGFDVTINGEFNLSPSYSVIGNVLEGGLNIPMARMVDEVNSVTEALDARNSSMQRLALGLGWKTWDVSARNEAHDLIKTEAKAKRKEEGIEKAKETRAANAKEKKRIEKATWDSLMDADKIKYFNTPKKERKVFLEKMTKEKGIK